MLFSYRPKLFTSFERHFAFRINSTTRYNPRMNSERVVVDPNELSPFKERPLTVSHPPRYALKLKLDLMIVLIASIATLIV